MEAFLSSIVIAALGGLTFLAYHHREFFMRIYAVLGAINIAVLCSVLIWSIAESVTVARLLPFITTNHDAALQAMAAHELPLWTIGLACFALGMLLTLLNRLPTPTERASR